MSAAGLLLILAWATPLLAAACLPWLRRPLTWLPWAAVPAVLTALLAGPGARVELPLLLPGTALALDQAGAVLLGCGALLWVVAGAHARAYLADAPRQRTFALFWFLTAAGSLGTFLAADVLSFYLSFSLMSLAAFGLVVHERTPSARRAARIYLILAVLGETALIAGLMVAGGKAESLLFADFLAALAISPWADWAMAGLVAGFGIKLGLVPLHFWLPLAHPEAPTPASAVLSGVIVTAGLVGCLRLLPLGMLEPGWGTGLVVVGLGTAGYGVVAGLPQTNPKVILAYSTVSQMGLLAAALGSMAGPQAGTGAVAAVVFYACHHGLAKGALFLGTGVASQGSLLRRRTAWAALALTALAIAGLPLTAGAVAKLALKPVFGPGLAGSLFGLSAVGTTLLMGRFLQVMAEAVRSPKETPLVPGVALSWALATLAALLIPWWLAPGLVADAAGASLTPGALWSAAWPVLTGGGLILLVARFWNGTLPRLPAGDLVVLLEKLAGRLATLTPPTVPGTVGSLVALPATLAGRVADTLGHLELQLGRWLLAGSVFLLLVGVLLVALVI